MQPKFGDRINLLLTDTDSFVFHIQSENVLQEIKPDIQTHFDTSNFPPDHFMYDICNKGVINKMKIEYPDNPILEVVALRAKNYSIKFANESEKKIAKGVVKPVIKLVLKHESYKNALFNNQQFFSNMSSIRSNKHILMTKSYRKLCLSPFDDKRYYLGEYGVKSNAHGHYKNDIEKQNSL